MTSRELIEHCEQSLTDKGCIDLDPEVLRSLSASTAGAAQERYGARQLLRLPAHEIEFFEWLRETQPVVWQDLWSDETQPPYLVSMAYLTDFVGAHPGVFSIRDLQTSDNYYFAPEMIIEKESTAFLDAVADLFSRKQPLTPAQLLALHASKGPVDIWHLAYHSGIDVDTLKHAVRQLVDDRILVHVPDAAHLAALFDVQ